MIGLPPNAHAAIAQIATTLGQAVTNSVVAQAASAAAGVGSQKSNKVDKIRDVLSLLWADRRRRGQAERFVVGLTIEAHSRAMQGKCEFHLEDVDAVIQAMRSLDLPAGALSQGEWRVRLSRRVSEPQQRPSPPPRPPQENSPTSRAAPQRYQDALALLSDLSSNAAAPQHRGRQLEIILLGVLHAEGLSPEHRVTSAGEEIDLAFSIEGHHYLIECKWERDRIGLKPLRDFVGKVNSKAEGTFGVMLSMSGFVDDINEKASRGTRLQAVGLSFSHLINVLEGRASWRACVQLARQHASRRSLFFVP
jgi:hypothetical protein